ncbi:alpha/beta fold hydrolase [Streptosporangium sp. NPDC051023]|uniref:alpha/beta fold hydrolase n=1 Tax=Streptosporangium sp. NPDC051023 TaxID=3155410 RepID=UPI00344CF820
MPGGRPADDDWSNVRRKYSLLAAVFVTVAALLPVSTAAGAATRDEAPANVAKGSVTWAPCEEEPSAECGTLAVPIDWSRPGGPTIDLALARRKATDPSARIGSMLINPGGPGGSGVEFAYGAPGFFTEEIQRRFDLVGFDPRGVGRSHPVICSASVYNQMPHAVMTSQADFDRWTAYSRRLRQDCRARTGPLYDHVDSVNVARDMDAIRAALGEEKLTYYGVSYGTLIGQMYAELFPQRVRALALDSNMDHSLGVKAFLDTEAAAVEDAFDEFVTWCEHETACALHGQDVRALWERLLAKARRGELYYPGVTDRPMTEVQVLWQGVLGTEGPAWQLLSEMLRALDGGPLPEWVPPLPGRQPVTGEVAQLPTAVLCEDYSLRVRNYREYAALLRSNARLAPDMRLNPMPIEDLPVCLNHPTNNPQHRLRYTGSAPLLLGTSIHDPSTPYAWTANVGRQLGPKVTLLTYEGWGHRIYGKDECSTVPIDNYLISLAVPPPGFRCLPGGGTTLKRKSEVWRTDQLHWAGLSLPQPSPSRTSG